MELLSPDISILIWTVLILIVAALPILALVNLLLNSSIENITKLIWAIVIVLVPVIGAIIYFLIGPVKKWVA